MSVFFVALMYVAWSSVFSLGKLALEHSPPLFLTAFRMLFAAVLILSFLLITKRSSLKLSLKQFASVLLLAFFSIYLTNTLEFWGLQYLSAAKTCFIYSLSPFFAALFSYIHFNEKMNPRKWIGLSIGFIGFIPVLLTQTGSEELLNAFSFFSWPTLAIIGAALSSVYGWVLLRLMVKEQEITPLVANGTSMLFGGLFALIHSYLIEPGAPFPISPLHLTSFIKRVMLITVISNLICYNLYGMFLKKYTATFMSFVGLLSPIFASLNAWLFLGETPSWIIVVSTSIVSTGLWIVYRVELKQGYIVSSKTPVSN
ncbi:S-adenosylmethionine/S-adenosylhomocysteine transporter [Candidatus Rhabdochlamydia oedothoracis]|uniref:S-adenosylmethionine/S-adenosylhomocysteine transporter n=2 Tax=Candidatus Rhabdochlamydia oedothoracis TaxID=2720720 RepID=A0ABX8V6D0_9BACT|nr:DMT family transporter [Candidatus Rhabdochlamydia sp. W815]KAG6558852.1 S-adenosylmethionine/S-adenosylhomocysteine transporter [Candidatus Rhabdochlamydia sp. W815]QYF49025.1 S-adenosylmethionine/S-adenosylhomocysteine transporter [Candidatus Rhabdochlamydia oedothoracis]